GHQQQPQQAAAEGSSSSGDIPCAFLLDFTRRPQDGAADAVVSLRLAPSYLTYNAAALRCVAAFFASDKQLQVGTLQAQAAARAQQLQRLAQLRLRALSSSSTSPTASEQQRPRLALSLIMHAPKLALPDDKGRATLLLDLGCFSLRSVQPVVQGLTPGSEEASLYECFDLGLQRVEAAIVGGAFAWPSSSRPYELPYEELPR
ncbi:hypothetical protein Agub_g14842, partial [Astrephomene gubernaculifera]